MNHSTQAIANGNDPARPCLNSTDYCPGMTKREEMASRILVGLLQSYGVEMASTGGQQVVRDALWYTDELLRQLKESEVPVYNSATA